MNCKTLHSLLGVDKSNPLFEVLFDPEIPDELLVHFGMMFLESVPRNSFQEKLLIARLFNAGFNQLRLHETFKYAIKTMRHWGELLKSGDAESISRIADGQGAVKKINADKLQYILYLFANHHHEQGCHITSYIVQQYFKLYHESISNETIRLIINKNSSVLSESNIVEYPVIIYSEEAEIRSKIIGLFNINIVKTPPVVTVKRENSWNNSEIPCSSINENSNYSPYLAFGDETKFPIIEKSITQLLSCHHIGILLTRFMIDFISDDLNEIADIVRQWLAMILNGCHNIEQGRALNYRALELFIGRQKRSADKQRITLKSIATQDNMRLLFSKNMRMINGQDDDSFLLDPHGVPYTGQLPILKCWLGGSHSIGKGYYLDLIHTLNGEPVFSLIDDNYYDLRQRLVAIVTEFRKILGGDKGRFLTFIIDRAIYDVEFMKKMYKENIYIITWEKNYKKGVWDAEAGNYLTETFSIMKFRNRQEDTYNYTVQFFKRRWDKESSFAQYIVMLSKPKKAPIELSIICTQFDRNSIETIKPILTRWLQEQDIGYLISLGINQITSYSHYSYDEIAQNLTDRMIDNKEFNKLSAEKLKLKKQLGMLLLNRETYIECKEQELSKLTIEQQSYELELEDENISQEKSKKLKQKIKKTKSKMKTIHRNKNKTLNKNSEKQQPLRTQIKNIEIKLGDMPKKISRIEKLINEEYVKLNFMPKSLMDAIKMIARNIIYQLLEVFRPIWNNYRNDLVILRELIMTMGHINETQSTIYILLNPTRQFGKKDQDKVNQFLFEISKRVNKTYRLEKVIIFSLYEI